MSAELSCQEDHFVLEAPFLIEELIGDEIVKERKRL